MIRGIQSWSDSDLSEAIHEIEEAMGWAVKGPWLAGTEYLKALEAEADKRREAALSA